MSRKDAEILYWITEFIAEIGQWSHLCDYLKEKGFSGDQIANAVNDVADKAGFNSNNLTKEDCE
jgi:hypothetical protein